MRIEVFETYYAGQQGRDNLNALLAQDGKTITVDRILTAASGSEMSHRHYVTVVYYTLEAAPEV